jgi:predicted heme/steroid binding protein
MTDENNQAAVSPTPPQTKSPTRPTGYIITILLLVVIIVVGFFYYQGKIKDDDTTTVNTNVETTIISADRILTAEEVAAFDGKDGRAAYYTYEGLVYDVTGSPLWEEGSHPGGHKAGEDLTGAIDGAAPHGEEVFEGFAIVGKVVE